MLMVSEDGDSAQDAQDAMALPPVVGVLLGRLPAFVAQLAQEERDAVKRRTTFGQDVEVLGLRRLQLVQLLCELVHSDYDAVFTAFADQGDSNPMVLCLDIFFKFEFCNMVHRIVMGAMLAIIERAQ